VTECPACGAPVAADDQFCETCGATLGTPTEATPVADSEPPATSVSTQLLPPVSTHQHCSCGGEIDADGWCTVCGLRAVSDRDHYTEQVAPNVAAVCDKGRVHPRNEDAIALAASRDRIVIVVCDGVSTSTDSDVASLAAARTARDVLDQTSAPESRTALALVELWTKALARAVAAAQERAVASAAAVGARENPPSSTLVAAIVDGPVLVAGWVGDSRCYWFGDDGATVQVSVDDSWASTQIAQGTARTVAEADPRAHAITRWLGVDAPPGGPTCTSVPIESGGWLLVCSDGLWNYCSAAADLRMLLEDDIGRLGDDPLVLASELCDWANAQGGHDNVTVALAHVPASPSLLQGSAPEAGTESIPTTEPVPVSDQPA
jgi:serine/threonine protein phosphatase PrpC